MKTTTNNEKGQLIKKYHALCSKLGMSEDERREMLWDNFKVISSKDLYIDQLKSICRVLDQLLNPHHKKMDDARKRVFGAVGGWLDLMYGKVSAKDLEAKKQRHDKIKAIACRQTGYRDFNKIPLERLNNVIHLFAKKQKDLKRGVTVIEAELATLANLN